MDRTRESRRGGGHAVSGHAVSGHATARRRPRSTFKDSSVICDEEEGLNESHDSSRLRERSTSNNIGNSSSKKERSSLSSNRNKRKRPSLPERFHGRDREMERDEGDESSEESSAAEAEEEEEDDDEPPHRPSVNPNPNLNPKRTAKFKSQWKVSEELMGVGLVPFPRKARSVSAKRHHDSSSSSPSPLLLAASVSAASDCNPQLRQKSPSPVLANVATGASPSSSHASLKPGRRMKPIGSKPKPSKMAKVSNSISEREVEVAEVLYGLTRQFQSEHHRQGVESYGNANPSKEFSNEGSLAGVISRVSSPMIPPSSSVVSSPSSSPLPQHSTSAAAPALGQAPPTAPKKKRPRPTKLEEANCGIVMRPPATVSLTSVVASCSSGIRNENEPSFQYHPAAKIEVSSLKLEALARNSSGPNANANANVNANQITAATPSPSPPPPPPPTSPPPVPANQNLKEKVMPIVGDNTSADFNPITSGKSKEVEMSDLKTLCENTTPESKPISCEKAGADIKVESIDPEEKKPSEDLDVSEAQIDRIDNKEMEMPCGSETKVEATIIPPQSPKAENIVEEKFKIDLMAPPEKSEDESVADACGIAASELPRVEQITQIPEIKAVDETESREGELKAEEIDIKHEKSDEGEEKGLEKQNVKDRSINLELDLENPEKDSKKPLQQKQSRITRNESKTEKAEKPVSAAAVGTSASGVASMPICMPGQPWPGVLGYFASPSTNWPCAPSILEGTNTTAAIQPPYILQQSRQTWKRCATHSYIAHLIDCQQRMAQLPVWTAANYLGSRQYNLNAPFTPSSEVINYGGSISGTVSASSAGNSISMNRVLDSLHDKAIGTTPLVEFNSQSAKEKISNNTDARRKQPSNQQATRQIGSTVMQCGVGGANSGTAGKSGNAEASLNASPASVSVGTGPANSNLTSISADAQYMAMLQNGYSYAHFGTGYNGAPNQIGQQQVAQFFNPPFYATQLLHQPQSQSQPQSQQQGPQNPSTSSGSSSSQQHKQQVQGSRKFPAPRKQQQQGTPSPSPSNSQQHHHLPTSQARHIDREANNEGDSPSTADSRHPVLQKTFYSPGSPSNSNLGVSSSLPASGVRIQAQDLNLMSALGGKQNGKQQQLPLQLQHQVAAGYTIPPHHGNDPTVQMSLKGLELSPQAIAAFSQNQGLLCFPSIAQCIPDSARHQMAAAAAQAQQNAVQPGLHPQRSGQLQKTQTSNACDERNIVDLMSNAGGRGYDEERKSSMRGGLAHSLNFSRIETENSTNIGSPTDGCLSTSLVANNMDSMSKIQSRSSQPAGNSSQGNPQLSSTQQLNQNTKQTVSRAKNVPNSNIAPPVASAQTTMSGFPDRSAVPSNLSKFQAPLSSFPGQNLKQGQQSPQWKMAPRTAVPSTITTAVGGPSQAIFVAPVKTYPQQPRNHQGNTNTGTSLVGSPQASYVTNTKSAGQLPINQKNNSNSITASRVPSPNVSSVVGSVPASSSSPVSKSLGSPASRSPTGSKGSSLQQKPVAPSSNRRSSPVSSRSMPSVLGPSQGSQSSSGKSAQQQYQQQQQQSMPPIASGQPAGLKSQQYQQQKLLHSHAQFLQQQAAQQPQYPGQTGQLAVFHQKQQMHGSNSPQPSFSSALRQQQEQHQQMHGSNFPQPSFSTNLRQQEQQQQMQSASSTQSTPGMLSLGPPTLTLGGAAGPGKVNPGGSLGGGSKGNPMLQAQYGQQHLGSPHATMASPYMQAATNVSTKSVEQRIVAAEVLNEQMNGVRMIQNSANQCTSASQNRCSFSTSSPQSSSTRMPSGSLKKPEGGNSVETITNPSGLSLSMAPCSGIRTNNIGLTAGGNAVQNAKTASVNLAAVHSSQMPHMPIHQPAVPLAGGSITPTTSTSTGLHGQTATSVVQP